MKLFLSSEAILAHQVPDFAALVGKEPGDTRIAFIENAADVEEGSEEWLSRNRNQIAGHGFMVSPVDLREHIGQEAIRNELAQNDVIWLAGGNTFYLRWLLRQTGADKVITDLVSEGTVYAGSSAGAIVAGPTLRHFETADDPKAAPEVVWDGLRLTQTVVVPHMDNKGFAPIVRTVNEQLITDGFDTVPLNDSQALVIDGDTQRVI